MTNCKSIKKSERTFKPKVSLLVITCLVLQTLHPFTTSAQTLPVTPLRGTTAHMLMPSPRILANPFIGLHVEKDDPWSFHFLMETKQTSTNTSQDIQRLTEYFLAGLAIPEKHWWVNLSPHEPDRILPKKLIHTQLGQDFLKQDYQLKQLTASMMHPDLPSGERFWENVYQKAYELFETTDIPINTFHKVWIVPEKAEVITHNNVALITNSSLDVMLEQDYIQHRQTRVIQNKNVIPTDHDWSTQIVKDVILPVLKDEINHGRHFIKLREIYHSLILAVWFKKNIRHRLQAYFIDQNNINGFSYPDNGWQDHIYKKYVQSFHEGVFKWIEEDYDPYNQDVIQRHYFSGGLEMDIDQQKNWLSLKEENSTSLTKHIASLAQPSDVKVNIKPITKKNKSILHTNILITLLLILFLNYLSQIKPAKPAPTSLSSNNITQLYLGTTHPDHIQYSIKDQDIDITFDEDRIYFLYMLNDLTLKEITNHIATKSLKDEKWNITDFENPDIFWELLAQQKKDWRHQAVIESWQKKFDQPTDGTISEVTKNIIRDRFDFDRTIQIGDPIPEDVLTSLKTLTIEDFKSLSLKTHPTTGRPYPKDMADKFKSQAELDQYLKDNQIITKENKNMIVALQEIMRNHIKNDTNIKKADEILKNVIPDGQPGPWTRGLSHLINREKKSQMNEPLDKNISSNESILSAIIKKFLSQSFWSFAVPGIFLIGWTSFTLWFKGKSYLFHFNTKKTLKTIGTKLLESHPGKNIKIDPSYFQHAIFTQRNDQQIDLILYHTTPLILQSEERIALKEKIRDQFNQNRLKILIDKNPLKAFLTKIETNDQRWTLTFNISQKEIPLDHAQIRFITKQQSLTSDLIPITSDSLYQMLRGWENLLKKSSLLWTDDDITSLINKIDQYITSTQIDFNQFRDFAKASYQIFELSSITEQYLQNKNRIPLKNQKLVLNHMHYLKKLAIDTHLQMSASGSLEHMRGYFIPRSTIWNQPLINGFTPSKMSRIILWIEYLYIKFKDIGQKSLADIYENFHRIHHLHNQILNQSNPPPIGNFKEFERQFIAFTSAFEKPHGKTQGAPEMIGWGLGIINLFKRLIILSPFLILIFLSISLGIWIEIAPHLFFLMAQYVILNMVMPYIAPLRIKWSHHIDRIRPLTQYQFINILIRQSTRLQIFLENRQLIDTSNFTDSEIIYREVMEQLKISPPIWRTVEHKIRAKHQLSGIDIHIPLWRPINNQHQRERIKTLLLSAHINDQMYLSDQIKINDIRVTRDQIIIKTSPPPKESHRFIRLYWQNNKTNNILYDDIFIPEPLTAKDKILNHLTLNYLPRPTSKLINFISRSIFMFTKEFYKITATRKFDPKSKQTHLQITLRTDNPYPYSLKQTHNLITNLKQDINNQTIVITDQNDTIINESLIDIKLHQSGYQLRFPDDIRITQIKIATIDSNQKNITTQVTLKTDPLHVLLNQWQAFIQESKENGINVKRLVTFEEKFIHYFQQRVLNPKNWLWEDFRLLLGEYREWIRLSVITIELLLEQSGDREWNAHISWWIQWLKHFLNVLATLKPFSTNDAMKLLYMSESESRDRQAFGLTIDSLLRWIFGDAFLYVWAKIDTHAGLKKMIASSEILLKTPLYFPEKQKPIGSSDLEVWHQHLIDNMADEYKKFEILDRHSLSGVDKYARDRLKTIRLGHLIWITLTIMGQIITGGVGFLWFVPPVILILGYWLRSMTVKVINKAEALNFQNLVKHLETELERKHNPPTISRKISLEVKPLMSLSLLISFIVALSVISPYLLPIIFLFLDIKPFMKPFIKNMKDWIINRFKQTDRNDFIAQLNEITPTESTPHTRINENNNNIEPIMKVINQTNQSPGGIDFTQLDNKNMTNPESPMKEIWDGLTFTIDHPKPLLHPKDFFATPILMR